MSWEFHLNAHHLRLKRLLKLRFQTATALSASFFEKLILVIAKRFCIKYDGIHVHAHLHTKYHQDIYNSLRLKYA